MATAAGKRRVCRAAAQLRRTAASGPARTRFDGARSVYAIARSTVSPVARDDAPQRLVDLALVGGEERGRLARHYLRPRTAGVVRGAAAGFANTSMYW